jgi:hypothetical protein
MSDTNIESPIRKDNNIEELNKDAERIVTYSYLKRKRSESEDKSYLDISIEICDDEYGTKIKITESHKRQRSSSMGDMSKRSFDDISGKHSYKEFLKEIHKHP